MRAFAFSIDILFVSLLLASCNRCSSKSARDTSYLDGDSDDTSFIEKTSLIDNNSINIPYTEMYGNTITIPVRINGMALDMIFDTGASSTCISLAEAQYLYNKGKLTNNDIINVQQFQTADGNISAGLLIILRDVSIGNEINLHNVEAIVVQNQKAPLLLGQSVMKQFREISMDRANGVIKFFE